MRHLPVLAAALFACPGVLLIGCGTSTPPKDDTSVKDEDAVLGTWNMDQYQGGKGVRLPPPEAIGRMWMTFSKDGKLLMSGRSADDKPVEGPYTLDPAAKPKAIDVTVGDTVLHCAYELDGDTLKLCFMAGLDPGERASRPSELTSTGDRIALITYKRAKGEKEDK